MRTVLFVDDEPRVLDGLRRMLYGMRREWQMDFAEGGVKALDLLAAHPYDVVVSDMRMPGMEGSELLREVMLRYPATVRIVLSGQCDRQTVLRAVEPTHQFLTKPCDPESLKRALIRAFQRRDQLTEEWHKELVSRVVSVPSLPALHDELLNELQSPGASLRRVAEIVATDIGMTAKIMQLISTSFFGTPQRLADPVEAVRLFDLDTLRALALSTGVFSPFSASGWSLSLLERLSEHGRTVAATAKAITEAEGGDASQAEDAHLAGLLHDIGLVVLLQHTPLRAAAVLQTSREKQIPLGQAEKLNEHETHAEIGGYLMALWGLPEPIIEAITFHHAPRDAGSTGFAPLTAVHVATALDADWSQGMLGAPDPLDHDYLARLGRLDRLDVWRDLARSLQSRRGSPLQTTNPQEA